MKYSLSTDHIIVTETDRAQIDKKLIKLEKLVHEPFNMDIRIRHDTHHQKGQVVTCIVNLEQGKRVFHTERSASSIQTAIDEAVAALRQELHRAYKK